MGSGSSAKNRYIDDDDNEGGSSRNNSKLRRGMTGLSEEQRKALDEEEQPISRGWQENFWNCTRCGAPLTDIQGENMCHPCHQKVDPKWHASRTFSKPKVMLGANKAHPNAVRDFGHDHFSKLPNEENVVEMERENARQASKGAFLKRISTKGTVAEGSLERSATNATLGNYSSEASDGSSLQRKPSRLPVDDTKDFSQADRSLSLSRKGTKALAQITDDEPSHVPAQPPVSTVPRGDDPPPFSGVKAKPPPMAALKHPERFASKKKHHSGEEKSEHHHHHHHEEHHHHKLKKQSLSQSIDLLAHTYDAWGHILSLGDRVIGEGKIGEDMGVGTVTGANTSHGHGMVIVQFDQSGESHPMKGEHLIYLDAKHETDIQKKLEKIRKEKEKRSRSKAEAPMMAGLNDL